MYQLFSVSCSGSVSLIGANVNVVLPFSNNINTYCFLFNCRYDKLDFKKILKIGILH